MIPQLARSHRILQIALALVSVALVTLSGVDTRQMLGMSLLIVLPWLWLLRRAQSGRPDGAITSETVGEWIPLVAGVSGYGVTIVDSQRRIGLGE